jgi:SAM-dependent methyltransferase
MRVSISKLLPDSLQDPWVNARKALLNTGLDIADAWDALLGRRRPLVPPRRLSRSIGGSFERVGSEFLRHFVSLGSLNPNESLLDVGCGVGRMAVPLTGYLNRAGHYEGFDIMRDAVEWCSRTITPAYPNFRFQWAAVYNREYNPHAPTLAKDYKFPYQDASFDFVFLTSVFTHMLPEDVANYMREIRRVLKPGGRCLISWFVLDPRSRASMAEGRAVFNFHHAISGCFTARPSLPEAAIAYDLDAVLELYRQAGLSPPQIFPGQWRGDAASLSGQDVLLSHADGDSPK